MDQQAQQPQRGRSPSAGHHQHHITHSHSPSPASYPPNDPSIGLGLTLNQAAHQSYDSFNDSSGFLGPQQSPPFPPPTHQQHASFAQASISDPAILDPTSTASFGQQVAPHGSDTSLPYNSQPQQTYLSPNLNNGDFSVFPSASGQGDQFNTPLFDQPTLTPNDMNNMASPQPHHSPTPPHLLQPDGRQPGSAHQSPAFNQHQFSSPPGGHSRHASLGPEAALLPNQIADWSQPQFQGHRRSPSEYSEVSSVAPSPNLVSSDAFEGDVGGHSPAQRPSDGGFYPELRMSSFSISDSHIGNPGHHGHSPSHSPAISPRIMPRQGPDMNQSAFGLAAPMNAYSVPSAYPDLQGPMEAFPNLHQPGAPDLSSMAPPAINIDFAPTNIKSGAFNNQKSSMNQDSLTPPDRGMHHHLEDWEGRKYLTLPRSTKVTPSCRYRSFPSRRRHAKSGRRHGQPVLFSRL